MDPRRYIIDKRLANIDKIIVVASSKGGVGKTIISTLMAIASKYKGFKAGLLDLDFTNPSTHIILGIKKPNFVEDKGIVPSIEKGIRYMSIVHFIGNKPLMLRGLDVDNIILELLAITRWGSLDYLFIDTPPGLGDEILDIINIIRRGVITLVTQPTKLGLEAILRAGKALSNVAEIAGVIWNMWREDTSIDVNEISKAGLETLSKIPYVEDIDLIIDKYGIDKLYKDYLRVYIDDILRKL